MLVKDIIHKSDAVSDLFRLILSERYPHALLLSGGIGRGKLAIARALAQFLICDKPTEDSSCGTCPNCRKAQKCIHPDIHFSFPITGAKATCNDFMNIFRDFITERPYAAGTEWITEMGEGKKNGNMTAAECNRISHIVHLKPYEANKKIVIIWLPEYLGKEGNRLLKMIEEPPEETYFIFVSDQAELILTTILSRCQILNIPPLPSSTIAEFLVEKSDLELESANTIANLSDGNLSEAIKMSKQSGNKFLPLWIQYFRATYQGHPATVSKSVEEIASLTKEEMKTYFSYCIHFLRQCLLLRHMGESGVQLLPAELDLAKKVITVIDDESIQGVSSMLNEASYHLERNANMKSSLLSMAIRMNRILIKDALVA